MPKLAIYVPKKEMKELEKWRSKINFSQVFMRAVKQEMNDRSRKLPAKDERVAAAAKFYRRKLQESSEPLEQLGFELGSKQVLDCRLSAEIIHQLLELQDAEITEPEQIELVEAALGKAIKSIDKRFEQEGYDEETLTARRSVALRGFVKGVAASWQRVCQLM